MIPQPSQELGSQKTLRILNPRMLSISFNEERWVMFLDIEKVFQKERKLTDNNCFSIG